MLHQGMLNWESMSTVMCNLATGISDDLTRVGLDLGRVTTNGKCVGSRDKIDKVLLKKKLTNYDVRGVCILTVRPVVFGAVKLTADTDSERSHPRG
jgi:hypothetical protein